MPEKVGQSLTTFSTYYQKTQIYCQESNSLNSKLIEHQNKKSLQVFNHDFQLKTLNRSLINSA